MAHPRWLLLAGALTVSLLACQSVSAAPGRPASDTSSERAALKPAAGASGQSAGAAKPAAPAQQAAKPSSASGPTRQSDDGVPRIALQELPYGFKQPVDLTSAHDGSDRMFVVEKGGTIRIVKGDQLLPTPFLDISSKITTSGT